MNQFKNFFAKIGRGIQKAFRAVVKWVRSLFTKDKMEELAAFYRKKSTKSFMASLLCILFGIFVGFVVMLILSFTMEGLSVGDAFHGLAIILLGPFTGMAQYIATGFGDMIFYAAPLIMTGLSVAIAFKTGLFNIGAPGQFLMGTMGSLLVALNIRTGGGFAGIMVWLLALVVGTLFGMLWGAIPGIFKAFLNVNEVIVCIMTNWIAANIVSWVFSGMRHIINTGNGKAGYLITTAQTGNGTPTLFLDKLFPGSYIDIGIILAIAIAILIGIMLNKTTFGYEIKACGYNRYGAKYAGMSEKKNIVYSMMIAGALSAMGGALYYLNPGIEFHFASAYQTLPDYGFNGIPVALLASNNPIGVIFSGLFLRYLAKGGDNLVDAGFNRYISDIIVAIVIYLAGFSKLILEVLQKRQQKRDLKKAQAAEEKGGNPQ